MAMIDLSTASGMPEWASSSYDQVATVVAAVAIGSLIAGVIGRIVPGRGYGHGLHVFVVATAATVFVGWALATVLASDAPSGGQFCYTPYHLKTEDPEICASYRPVWMLSAPLAVLLALATAGLSLTLPSRRRWLFLGLLMLAVAAVAMEINAEVALVEAGVFGGGGIVSIRAALQQLTVEDPINAIVGIVVAVVLVIRMVWMRGERKRNPPTVEFATAKSPP